VADILVVEDESVIRSALKRFLERSKYRVFEAASVKEAEENFKLERFSLIISDLRLPGAPGTDLIKRAGDVPVLIMTSYASLRSAVDAMRMGAVDYIAKPFDYEDLLVAIRRILRERSTQRLARDRDPGRTHCESAIEGMVGNCPAMLDVYERIAKVAPTAAATLIRGETGTGKELVARAIHKASKRAAQPLICFNCASVPESMLEAELFGSAKSAQTGAAGLLEAADGGTLFLDEVGELPLDAQARLLRFMNDGEIPARDTGKTRRVDVRLIAATQRNLRQLCDEGRFRQDLFYRINVVEILLPALRDRGRDVLKIAEFLLDDACRRHQKLARRFSPEAIQAITSYRWPGNIRELENALERAVILNDEQEVPNGALSIDLELINVAEMAAVDSERSRRDDAAGADEPAEDLSLEEYFQHFVLQNQDHMSETELARKLGVSRKCLWERRQRFGIPRKKSAADEESSGRRSA